MPLPRSLGLAAALGGEATQYAVDPYLSMQQEASTMNPFSRGWASAGIQGDVGSSASDAVKAQIAQDQQAYAESAAMMEEQQRQAAIMQPDIHDYRQVTGLGSALGYLGGQAGNLRTSVPAAAGSLAGRGLGLAAGAAVAPFVGPAAVPIAAAVGGYAGGALAGYNMEAEETLANAMSDPVLRQRIETEPGFAQKVLDASRVKGGINALLESVVPTMLGSKLIGNSLAKEGAKKIGTTFGERLAHVAGTGAVAAPFEGATEGSQNITGQMAMNYLHDKGLTENLDPHSAINEAIGGMVGGGVMGSVGGMADIAHQSMSDTMDEVQKRLDKPLGERIIEGAGDLGVKAGELFSDGLETVGSAWNKHGPDIDYDQLTKSREPDASQPSSQYTVNKKNYDDSMLLSATRFAQKLTDPNRATDWFSDDHKTAAIEFQEGKIDAKGFAEKIKALDGIKTTTNKFDKITSELTGNAKESALAPSDPSAVVNTETGEIDDIMDLWARELASKHSEHNSWLDADLSGPAGNTRAVAQQMASRKTALRAIGEWVRNGFKDPDTGETFVPQSFLDEFGDKSPTAIMSAATLMRKQGIISEEVRHSAVAIAEDLEAKQSARQNTLSSVIDSMTPLYKDRVAKEKGATDDGSKRKVVLTEANKLVKVLEVITGKPTDAGVVVKGLTADARSALKEAFGGDYQEVLQAAISRKQQKLKGGMSTGMDRNAQPAEENTQEDTGSDAVAGESDGLDFDDDRNMEEYEPSAAVTYHSQRGAEHDGKRGIDMAFPDSKANLKKSIDAVRLKFPQAQVKAVGVVDALREKFGLDKATTRQAKAAIAKKLAAAEDELLVAHGVKLKGTIDEEFDAYLLNMLETQGEEHAKGVVESYGGLEEMKTAWALESFHHGKSRKSERSDALKSVNENFKVVRAETLSDDRNDLSVTNINDFAAKRNPGKHEGTALAGTLYIEEIGQSGKPNVRPFITSMGKLLKHASGVDQSNITSSDTAQALLDKALAALGELLYAGAEAGRFGKKDDNGDITSIKVGYKTVADGPIIWLEPTLSKVAGKGKTYNSVASIGQFLPGNFRIMNGVSIDSLRALINGELNGLSERKELKGVDVNSDNFVQKVSKRFDYSLLKKMTKPDLEDAKAEREDVIMNQLRFASREDTPLADALRARKIAEIIEKKHIAAINEVIKRRVSDFDTDRDEDMDYMFPEEGTPGTGDRTQRGSSLHEADPKGLRTYDNNIQPFDGKVEALLVRPSDTDKGDTFVSILRDGPSETKVDWIVKGLSGQLMPFVNKVRALSAERRENVLSTLQALIAASPDSVLWRNMEAVDKDLMMKAVESLKSNKLVSDRTLDPELARKLEAEGAARSKARAAAEVAAEEDAEAEAEVPGVMTTQDGAVVDTRLNAKKTAVLLRAYRDEFQKQLDAHLEKLINPRSKITAAQRTRAYLDAAAETARVVSAKYTAGVVAADKARAAGEDPRAAYAAAWKNWSELEKLPPQKQKKMSDWEKIQATQMPDLSEVDELRLQGKQNAGGTRSRDVLQHMLSAQSKPKRKAKAKAGKAVPQKMDRTPLPVTEVTSHVMELLRTSDGSDNLLAAVRAANSSEALHSLLNSVNTLLDSLPAVEKARAGGTVKGQFEPQGATALINRLNAVSTTIREALNMSAFADKAVAKAEAAKTDDRVPEATDADYHDYMMSGEKEENPHGNEPYGDTNDERENAMGAFARIKDGFKALRDGDYDTVAANIKAAYKFLASNTKNGTEAQYKRAERLLSDLVRELHDLTKPQPKAEVSTLTKEEINEKIAGLKRKLGMMLSEVEAKLEVAPITEAEQQSIIDMLKGKLGEGFETVFRDILKGRSGKPISGMWVHKNGRRIIAIAMGAKDPWGVAYHEALHDLMHLLRENKSEEIIHILQNVAMLPQIQAKLKTLLAEDEGALAQLSGPNAAEESAAYMFQFWNTRNEKGERKLELGPRTETFFQKIMNAIQRWTGLLSDQYKDQLRAELVLQSFTDGYFSGKNESRESAFNKTTAGLLASPGANKYAGKLLSVFNNNSWLQNGLFTAIGVLQDTKLKPLTDLGSMFYQDVGEKMGKILPMFTATKQERNRRLNVITSRIRKFTNEQGFGPEGLKKVNDFLLAEAELDEIKVPEMRELVRDIRAYLEEMHAYASTAKVKRFDFKSLKWVAMGKIQHNYYPRNINTDYLTAHKQKFIDGLKKHHMGELEAIAKDAVESVKAELAQQVAATQARISLIERSMEGRTENSESAEFAVIHKENELNRLRTLLNQLTEKQKKAAAKVVTVDDVAEEIVLSLLNKNGAPDVTENTSTLGITPFAAAVNRRSLTWLDTKQFTEFYSDDLVATMTNYTVQMVKRVEYVRRFGNEGETIQQKVDEAWATKTFDTPKLVSDIIAKFDAARDKWLNTEHKSFAAYAASRPNFRELAIAEAERQGVAPETIAEKMIAADKFLKAPLRAILAMEGTLGRDVDQTYRNITQGITAYNNARLLMLTLFSSFVDPAGIMIRGGEMTDAYAAFARGVKDVVRNWKKMLGSNAIYPEDEMATMAIEMGVVNAETYLDLLGETYASQYAGDSRIHRFNDALFRINGMEAWNRAMRIQGTGAALGFLKRHLTNPTADSKRYLEDELGLTAGVNYLRADGSVDHTNPDVQKAVITWVDSAILNPNAAQRPIVASDPHYAIFYHLKQFTYSFQKVIIARTIHEAKHGNYNPMVTMVGTYVPIAIAADVIKSLLIPFDDEPVWMKSLTGIVGHGVQRGLSTVPGVLYEATPWIGGDRPRGLPGPAFDQITGILLTPFDENRTAFKEAINALPAATLLNRYTK